MGIIGYCDKDKKGEEMELRKGGKAVMPVA